MSKDLMRSHRDRANELRTNGDYVEAGEYYSLAAYCRFGERPPDSYGINMSAGQVNLLRAAICYRVGGRSDRCRTRCRQGELIAEEMIDRVFSMDPPEYHYDRARRGVWYEYLGDFRCIGEIGDPDRAYERAIVVYEDAGDPGTECSEQEHGYTMAVYREVARAVDQDPGPIDSMRNELTLTDWVAAKRETYPSLLDELDERGKW